MQEYTDRAVSIMSPVQQSAHFHACSCLVRGVVDAGSNLMSFVLMPLVLMVSLGQLTLGHGLSANPSCPHAM